MPGNMSVKPKASSHESVYRLVRRRQFHTAAELYSYAQARRDTGDSRLLFYCSGTDGKVRKTLQDTVDTIWAPETVKPSVDGGAHKAPLSKERLAALKVYALRAAKSSKKMSKEVTAEGVEKAARRARHGMGHIKDSLSNAKEATLAAKTRTKSNAGLRTAEIELFDHFGRRAEVVIHPRNGVWRLRDFYEVLVACRTETATHTTPGSIIRRSKGENPLARISPSSTLAGGFKIPRSEIGWKAMLQAGVASPDKPWSELSTEEQDVSAAEIRFCAVFCSLRWAEGGAAKGESEKRQRPLEDLWIDEMPKDPRFEEDMLAGTLFEEQLVQLSSHNYVEDRHWRALLSAFEACGHTLQQTSGFKVQRGSIFITGSKANVTRHRIQSACFGLQCAQASIAEKELNNERRKLGLPRRGSLMLLPGRSSQGRPDISEARDACIPQQAMMLENQAAAPARRSRAAGKRAASSASSTPTTEAPSSAATTPTTEAHQEIELDDGDESPEKKKQRRTSPKMQPLLQDKLESGMKQKSRICNSAPLLSDGKSEMQSLKSLGGQPLSGEEPKKEPRKGKKVQPLSDDETATQRSVSPKVQPLSGEEQNKQTMESPAPALIGNVPSQVEGGVLSTTTGTGGVATDGATFGEGADTSSFAIPDSGGAAGGGIPGVGLDVGTFRILCGGKSAASGRILGGGMLATDGAILGAGVDAASSPILGGGQLTANGAILGEGVGGGSSAILGESGSASGGAILSADAAGRLAGIRGVAIRGAIRAIP